MTGGLSPGRAALKLLIPLTRRTFVRRYDREGFAKIVERNAQDAGRSTRIFAIPFVRCHDAENVKSQGHPLLTG